MFRKPHQTSVPVFFALIESLLDIFQRSTFIAVFQNNFQNHRRVTEQLSETQAAFRKPEQTLSEGGGGLLEGITQLVTDVLKHAETLIWISFQKDN